MTKVAFLLTLIVTTLASIWTGAAQAETIIYLNWPGIVGSVTTPGYAGSIELTSYSQNFSANPKVVCGAVTIMKPIDNTSPDFLERLLRGQNTAGPVTITFVKQVKGAPTNFYTISLREVLLTSITQSDTEAPGSNKLEPPSESIAFTAARFEFTAGSTRAGFDCKTLKSL